MLSFVERIIMKKDRTKKVLIRLTEEEKNKLQEMAEEKEMKVEPFIRKTIFSNDIKKLSDENEALKDENRELKRFEEDLRKEYREALAEMKSTYEVMISANEVIISSLKETIKSKQVLIDSQETKKGFWSRLFKR